MLDGLTFEQNDLLSREKLAILLTKIIIGQEFYNSNDPKSIAIDGQWGAGKTQFISMWASMLKSSSLKDKLGIYEQVPNISVIYYNAWEYDNHPNALIPLAYTVCKSMGNDCFANTGKNSYEAFFKAAIGIATYPLRSESDLRDIASNLLEAAKERVEATKTSYSEIITRFIKEEENKKSIRKELREMCADNRVLIILIDELDRCKPSFAIDTLETVKHYFASNRVTCVYALDIQQLTKSIETVYGIGMDSYGYLSRFFDLQVSLNAPELKSFLENSNHVFLKDRTLNKFIQQIADQYSLSLRELVIILNSCNYILSGIFQNCETIPYYFKQLLFFIFVLQRKDSSNYESLIRNGSIELNNSKPSLQYISRFLREDFGISVSSFREKTNNKVSDPEYKKFCNQILFVINALKGSNETSIGANIRGLVECFKANL